MIVSEIIASFHHHCYLESHPSQARQCFVNSRLCYVVVWVYIGFSFRRLLWKAVLLTDCALYARVSSDSVAHLCFTDVVHSTKWQSSAKFAFAEISKIT